MTSALGLTSSPGKKAAQRLSREDAAQRAKKALADLELPLELDCKVKVERCPLASDCAANPLKRSSALLTMSRQMLCHDGWCSRRGHGSLHASAVCGRNAVPVAVAKEVLCHWCMVTLVCDAEIASLLSRGDCTGNAVGTGGYVLELRGCARSEP